MRAQRKRKKNRAGGQTIEEESGERKREGEGRREEREIREECEVTYQTAPQTSCHKFDVTHCL